MLTQQLNTLMENISFLLKLNIRINKLMLPENIISSIFFLSHSQFGRNFSGNVLQLSDNRFRIAQNIYLPVNRR